MGDKIVAGMYLSGNSCRIVAVGGNKESHEVLDVKTNKISINKNPSSSDAVNFANSIQDYCDENGVDKIVYNKRISKGKMASSEESFIMEGVILASVSVEAERVHSKTLKATQDKFGDLKTEKPSTADLGRAYDFAFEGLD
ncbi:DUF3010 family protein [Maridesulfovibrio salexigens]|uniref:Uncharacterized protein n=1 Tax=Maridesulfovibrio salexigens (strain ATCC 14822 / DSM 2638 / NCIMB 8403 / VKM B-1763) TaxID=526222 RepID=C6BZ64_MARSD|nr:DUF3010 family protein [Maridesulfovibrio salexigens]ACS78888.1 conserved hypothetical protein [Maridesulfovibrio salexigens DSM 2638]